MNNKPLNNGSIPTDRKLTWDEILEKLRELDRKLTALEAKYK